MSVAPPSTKICVTNNSPLSALRSFFCSQLAIAERSNFSTLAAASFEENFKTWFQTIQDVLDGDTAGHLLNLINSNALRCKTITLNQTNWIENEEETFEYTVEDITVTSNHLVQGHMDLKNQDKMSNGYIETFDGGYKIITSEKPEEDVTMNVSIQKGGDAL